MPVAPGTLVWAHPPQKRASAQGCHLPPACAQRAAHTSFTGTKAVTLELRLLPWLCLTWSDHKDHPGGQSLAPFPCQLSGSALCSSRTLCAWAHVPHNGPPQTHGPFLPPGKEQLGKETEDRLVLSASEAKHLDSLLHLRVEMASVGPFSSWLEGLTLPSAPQCGHIGPARLPSQHGPL